MFQAHVNYVQTPNNCIKGYQLVVLVNGRGIKVIDKLCNYNIE